MKQIVFATHNLYKLDEVQSFFKDFPIEIIGLAEFQEIKEIKETGQTFLENSLIKARFVFQYTDLPTIADDTGLEVDYLDGAPGVLSSRYAGKNSTDKENLEKLLFDLTDIPKKKRSAQFRTVISYVSGAREQWVEGTVKGIILTAPKGKNGFGYDPVFWLENRKKTFAELTLKEKNSFSHRGLALQKLRKLLANDGCV